MSKINEFNTIIRQAQADTLKLLTVDYHATAYGVLGLGTKASSDDIKNAYRTKMLAFHTDKIGNKGKELSQIIVAAYALLSDSDEKKQYDGILAPQPVQAPASKPHGASVFATRTFVNDRYVPKANFNQEQERRKKAFDLMTKAAQNTISIYCMLQKAYPPRTWWNRFFVTDYAYREELTQLKTFSYVFLEAINRPLNPLERNIAYISFTLGYADIFGKFSKKIKEKSDHSDAFYNAFLTPIGALHHLSESIVTLINHPNIELSNTKACFVNQGNIFFYTGLIEKSFEKFTDEKLKQSMNF